MARTRIVIRPVNTNVKIGLAKWDKGLRAFLKQEAREIFDYFDQVTPAFRNHSVTVKQKGGVRKSGGDLKVVVGVLDKTAGNKIFSYVNWGTGARWIYPTIKPVLAFRPGYKPATRPGSLRISPPWQRSGSFVRLHAVSHPGIEARRFDKVIQLGMQGDIEERGKKAFVELARQTWRGS